jgi:hypothetical protein
MVIDDQRAHAVQPSVETVVKTEATIVNTAVELKRGAL